jgi:hypothetical protein
LEPSALDYFKRPDASSVNGLTNAGKVLLQMAPLQRTEDNHPKLQDLEILGAAAPTQPLATGVQNGTPRTKP